MTYDLLYHDLPRRCKTWLTPPLRAIYGGSRDCESGGISQHTAPMVGDPALCLGHPSPRFISHIYLLPVNKNLVSKSTCNVSCKSVKCIFACNGANANTTNKKAMSFFINGKSLIIVKLLKNGEIRTIISNKIIKSRMVYFAKVYSRN